MRRVGYSVEKETYEEQSDAGRHNPGLVLLFRDKTGRHRVPISAGYRDEIDVYRQGDETYVLTKNRGLDYVGLEIFRGDESAGDIFLQVDYEITDTLGPRGLDLSDPTIIRRLSEYIY
jgi:hypothetical protein